AVAIRKIIPFRVSALRDPLRKWRLYWRQIALEFRNEADCLVQEGGYKPFKFAPDSPRRWLSACENDLREEMASECDNGNAAKHYRIHQDIGGWAYLFAVRELSLRHPSFDEDRIGRGHLSLNACRFLVLRFFAFARARRRFH